MPRSLPRPRPLGLVLSAAALSVGLSALTGGPSLAQPSPLPAQASSAQSQQAARSAAERILTALQSRSGVALYRLFSPNLQRMTSPALVQQRLRTMDPVQRWTIGAVEPGLDSSTVLSRLRGAAGERDLLLVIDAQGLLEGFHIDVSDQAAESVARRFVEDLSRGRYVSAQSLLSPGLQEEIPAPILQIKWQQLQRRTGDFVAIRRVLRAESTVDTKLVLVTTSFNRLTDSLFVILDSANRIVGVDFPMDATISGSGR